MWNQTDVSQRGGLSNNKMQKDTKRCDSFDQEGKLKGKQQMYL